jgi:hypothetical protein
MNNPDWEVILQEFIMLLKSPNAGLRFPPDVPPYQRFREGQGGDPAKKDVRKKTLEAGMCMKTSKYLTNCPENIRTFMS